MTHLSDIPAAEREKILKGAFLSLDPPRLDRLPAREKKRVVALWRVAQEIAPGRDYTEKEINEVLRAICPDFATLRRALVDYRFLSRTANGARYWRADAEHTEG